VVSDGLTIGKRESLGITLLGAVVIGGVFHGLGFLIVPMMIADNDLAWGGIGWIAFWTWLPFGIRRLERVHRVEDGEVVSTYHRRTVTRSLADVVLLSAAPFYLPAARVQFDDASAFWVWGPNTEYVISAVLEHAEHADNQLPPTDWLRPRRVVWFVLGLLAAGWEHR